MSEIKEYPWLLKAGPVNAILAGTQTQHRVPLRPQPEGDTVTWGCSTDCKGFGFRFGDSSKRVNTPWHPGDHIWIRETFYYEEHMHDLTAGEPDLPDGRYSHRCVYRADQPDYPVNVGVGGHGWTPSIHMPRWASRITLLVKRVWVERLQSISLEDALAEGLGNGDQFETHLDEWKALWVSCYGLESWKCNPWVIATEFERIKS